MIILLLLIIIFFGYLSGYIVSLYALAVYVDPDEIDNIVPEVSATQKAFLKKIAADPRALIQLAEIYKSFLLILITVLSLKIIHELSAQLNLSLFVLYPVGLIVLWFLYLMAVEIFPRYSSFTALNPDNIKHLWVIRVVYFLFLPIVKMYRKTLKRSQKEKKVTEEEKEEIVERAIETVAERAGLNQSIVDPEEREMINQIFLLDQTVIKEIMVPRIDIVGIEKSMSFRAIRALILKDGHSRYPVYEEKIDKIIGLIYVKDLFNNMPEPGEKFVLEKYLRKPFFVPETKIINELLREFKRKHQHIAIVVDEYGGVAGLVTLEDIIEEIFGEIQDEHDWEEDEFVKIDDHQYLVSANLMVEKLQDYLETDYEQEEYDTVGGLIYDLVGSVPEKGQIIKWHNIEFEIIKVEGQRILQVKVIKKSS
ncbi:MAG: HlyC/CorC family transporter [FCB group bacterium]|nr:HlyC/CorC family transporter [FCB group bacterium]